MKLIALLLILGIVNPLPMLAAQNAGAQKGEETGAGASDAQDDTRPIPAVQMGQRMVGSPDDLIGPNDEISITCLESDEISKVWRLSAAGDVNLPLVGQVHAAGLTAEGMTQKLTELLKNYIHEPHVTVFIAQFRSQPVTVTGAVHRPGVFQIEGSKSLLTVLMMAGGLDHPPGSTATLTRQIKNGPIPLPDAHLDADGTHSVAQMSLKDISDASTPVSNLLIKPNDVVDVTNDSRMVYIIGEVTKPGKIELVSQDSISVMAALAAAGGLTKLSKGQDTEIMRVNSAGLYQRVSSIDLKKLTMGRTEDRMLTPGDIVIVPSSTWKTYSQIAAFSAIATGFGLLTRF
jgi:polysaccharide export outer membrane protein